MIRTLTFVLVLAAGCGGKKSEPATTTTTTTTPSGSAQAAGSGSAGAPEAPREEMPVELTKFHDMLAPLWHMEKGLKRMKDTCAAVADLRAAADAVAKATPPTKANADTWTTGTRALIDAVTTVEAACKKKDNTKFEAAFSKVHDSFHNLMAQAGVEHKEDEKKEGAAHKH